MAIVHRPGSVDDLLLSPGSVVAGKFLWLHIT
jgi:hypothetical protein